MLLEITAHFTHITAHGNGNLQRRFISHTGWKAYLRMVFNTELNRAYGFQITYRTFVLAQSQTRQDLRNMWTRTCSLSKFGKQPSLSPLA